MIKQITVAECDICGAMEKARVEGTQRDEYNEVPKGWVRSATNNNFCICPKCWKKLNDKG